MPNFTVKKIPQKHIHKKDVTKDVPNIEKTKKSVRKIIFVSLVILGCIF